MSLTAAGDTAAAAIGELRGLSPNAHVMVKLSIYSAWAELQIASGEQRYLVDVVKPHIPKLTPLWLSTLREFARLKYEPDVSITSDSASMGESLDTLYVALNRRTLLKVRARYCLSTSADLSLRSSIKTLGSTSLKLLRL